MHSRRVFLTRTLAVAALFPTLTSSCENSEATQAAEDHIQSATAIAQVFGDGQKLTAVAVEFDQDIDNSKFLTSRSHSQTEHSGWLR
jgi:predicted peptidase